MNVQDFQNKLIGICKALNVEDLSMVEITIPEVKIYALTQSGEINFQMSNLKLGMENAEEANDGLKDDTKKTAKKNKVNNSKKVAKKTKTKEKDNEVKNTETKNDCTIMKFLSDEEIKKAVRADTRRSKVNLEVGIANISQVLLTKYSINSVTGTVLSKIFDTSVSNISHAASDLRKNMIKFISTYYKDAIIDKTIALHPIQNKLMRFYKNEFSIEELNKFINKCNMDIAEGKVKI